jgi:hypothetical protein
MSIPPNSIPRMCVQRFQEYVMFDSPAEYGSPPHLADYAYSWLTYDGGARECANDHAVFLSMLIVAEGSWRRNPLNYVQHGRPSEAPTVFFDLGCSDCRDVLDPQYFRMLAVDPDWANSRAARAAALDAPADEDESG